LRNFRASPAEAPGVGGAFVTKPASNCWALNYFCNFKKAINMSEKDDLSSFLKEGKPLIADYIETRIELLRLQAIKVISQSAGYLVWILVSLFLLFLILMFTGIVIGCWLSALTHSYVLGFGITTLLLVLVFIILAIFRDSFFVHPVIQAIIRKTANAGKEEEG
jgi:hypothetical protein